MKKQFIFLISIIFLVSAAPTLSAQKKRMLLFSEYSNGTILMKSGSKIQVKLNYDTANKNMMYLQGSDEMILLNSHEADTVYINEEKFIPFNSRFVEVVELSNGNAFIDWSLKLGHRGNRGAYGQITQNKVETINTANWSNREYRPESAEVVELKNDNEYWFSKKGELVKFKNEKNLIKHFPGYRDEIKSYIKENKVDFKKVNDVLALLNYCLGLS